MQLQYGMGRTKKNIDVCSVATETPVANINKQSANGIGCRQSDLYFFKGEKRKEKTKQRNRPPRHDYFLRKESNSNYVCNRACNKLHLIFLFFLPHMFLILHTQFLNIALRGVKKTQGEGGKNTQRFLLGSMGNPSAAAQKNVSSHVRIQLKSIQLRRTHNTKASKRWGITGGDNISKGLTTRGV